VDVVLEMFQGCTIVLIPTRDIQEFEDWILLIHNHGELLHNCDSIAKADVADATMLFESENYSLSIGGELW
jgi:hypothetical protein